MNEIIKTTKLHVKQVLAISYTYDFPTTLAGTGAGGCLTAKKGV